MKRIVSLLLALVMCLSLCACGKSNSGVTIDELEAAIKRFDAEAIVEKKSSKKGYAFSCAAKGSVGTTTIQGTADSNEMLESVVATEDVMSVDKFENITGEQLLKDSVDMNKAPLSRLIAYNFLMNFSSIVTILAPEGTSNEFDGLDFLISAIQEPKTYGNWKYTITTDANDNTATITAEFVGE